MPYLEGYKTGYTIGSTNPFGALSRAVTESLARRRKEQQERQKRDEEEGAALNKLFIQFGMKHEYDKEIERQKGEERRKTARVKEEEERITKREFPVKQYKITGADVRETEKALAPTKGERFLGLLQNLIPGAQPTERRIRERETQVGEMRGKFLGQFGMGRSTGTQLPNDITEEDIQFTMQKHGLTREEVLEKLGIQ